MATLLSYALTTVADVKESMGIASSDHSWDNLITRKINQVTRQVEAYCERRFLLTTYTEEGYNATRVDQMVLKNRPIVGSVLLEIRDNDLNENDFETVESDIYFVDNNAGLLNLDFRAIGHWGRYRATYSAGYATIPEDLAEAASALAAYYALYPDGSNVGIREKQEGARRLMFNTTQLLDFETLMEQLGVDAIINSYANLPVMTDR